VWFTAFIHSCLQIRQAAVRMLAWSIRTQCECPLVATFATLPEALLGEVAVRGMPARASTPATAHDGSVDAGSRPGPRGDHQRLTSGRSGTHLGVVFRSLLNR
jgi:hypothetical protein